MKTLRAALLAVLVAAVLVPTAADASKSKRSKGATCSKGADCKSGSCGKGSKGFVGKVCQ